LSIETLAVHEEKKAADKLLPASDRTARPALLAEKTAVTENTYSAGVETFLGAAT